MERMDELVYSSVGQAEGNLWALGIYYTLEPTLLLFGGDGFDRGSRSDTHPYLFTPIHPHRHPHRHHYQPDSHHNP